MEWKNYTSTFLDTYLIDELLIPLRTKENRSANIKLDLVEQTNKQASKGTHEHTNGLHMRS